MSHLLFFIVRDLLYSVDMAGLHCLRFGVRVERPTHAVRSGIGIGIRI